MSCTCRIAPMRSFIRGLAQVHRLDSSTTSSFRFNAPTEAAPRRIISTRAFHESRRLHQDAAAEAPAPSVEPTHEPAVDSSELNKSATGGNDDSGSKPPKTTKAQPKTTKPKTTKPRAVKTTKVDKKPRKTSEGSEDSSETPRAKRKTGRPLGSKASQDSAAAKAATQEKVQQKAKKVRDIADSIMSQRRVDESKQTPEESRKPQWLIQKEALKEKFPNGWAPHKKLSPDALAGIRALNAQFPDVYNVTTLAGHFKVSPENIRRILKSKWQPSQDEEEDRERRWQSRGKRIWQDNAAIGIKPPRKWREMGITRDKGHHAKRQAASEREQAMNEQEKKAYMEWRQDYNERKAG